MEMAESKKPPCIAAEQERLQAHMAGTLIDETGSILVRMADYTVPPCIAAEQGRQPARMAGRKCQQHWPQKLWLPALNTGSRCCLF